MNRNMGIGIVVAAAVLCAGAVKVLADMPVRGSASKGTAPTVPPVPIGDLDPAGKIQYVAGDDGGVLFMQGSPDGGGYPVRVNLDQVGGSPALNCDTFAAVSATGLNGKLKIVTGVSAKKIYLCGFSVTATSAVGVSWYEGTGTNCGTPGAAVTGVQQLAAKAQINSGLSPRAAAFTATAADDLCIQTDGASDVGGWISYTVK